MKTLGQIAYEAYLVSSGGVSLVSKAKLPTWDEQREEIKTAWEAAGEAVENESRDRNDYPRDDAA